MLLQQVIEGGEINWLAWPLHLGCLHSAVFYLSLLILSLLDHIKKTMAEITIVSHCCQDMIMIIDSFTTTVALNNKVCPDGKIFTNCGSACPATCKTYRFPVHCILLCVPGCFCPPGTVELGKACVPPSSCPSKLRVIKSM